MNEYFISIEGVLTDTTVFKSYVVLAGGGISAMEQACKKFEMDFPRYAKSYSIRRMNKL